MACIRTRRPPLHDSAATAHPAAHNPALLHHFAEEGQQRNAASLGMWVFLAQEVMFFGGLFCAYLIYRLKFFGDFGAASQTLDIKLGATNTIVLIGSSLTVVFAVWAAKHGKRSMLLINLVLTLILGCAFLGIKAVEYREKFEKHHVPGATFHFEGDWPGQKDIPEDQRHHVNPRHAEMFFSLYFIMTGLHALHMIIGIGLFLWLLIMAWKGRYTPQYNTPVEIGGLYWHFVDLVWIYLFPLLYLIDRHP
jgi:cytochrome c oxidase subunit 3